MLLSEEPQKAFHQALGTGPWTKSVQLQPSLLPLPLLPPLLLLSLFPLLYVAGVLWPPLRSPASPILSKTLMGVTSGSFP